MQTEIIMKANGILAKNMVKAEKPIKVAQNTKDLTKMEKNMEEELITSKEGENTMGGMKWDKNQEKAPIPILTKMDEYILEIGKMIKSMEKELKLSQTAANTKETLRMG